MRPRRPMRASTQTGKQGDMYGLVNRALQQLVCKQHSEQVWDEIRSRAGVAAEVFVRMDSYPDELTHRLVAAAAEVLQTPAEELLKEFGRYWMRYTMIEGYGALLYDLGPTLHDALSALDGMHARVTLLYPALKPPRFRIVHAETDRISLYYDSDRSGFAPMIVGLVEGLGERYRLRVEVQHAERKGQGCDQDRFDIHILGQATDTGMADLSEATAHA